jgi:hypothetical protein
MHAIGIAITTTEGVARSRNRRRGRVRQARCPPGMAFDRYGSLRGNNIVNAKLYASRVRITLRAILAERSTPAPSAATSE